VNALGIRRRLRRHRRRAAMIAAVVAFVSVIAAHHSGLDAQRVSGVHATAVADMCLGVIIAAGAGLAAFGFARMALTGRRSVGTPIAHGPVHAPPVPVARARHGPAAVSVLCVDRR